MIARLQLAGERAEDRGHAGGQRIAGLRPFEQRQALLEHGDGGIAVAAIDIAVILAREAALGGFGLVIDEARIEEEGFRGFAMRRAVKSAADELGGVAPAAGSDLCFFI